MRQMTKEQLVLTRENNLADDSMVRMTGAPSAGDYCDHCQVKHHRGDYLACDSRRSLGLRDTICVRHGDAIPCASC